MCLLFEYFFDLVYDDWQVMVVEDSLEIGCEDRWVVLFSVWDVFYCNKK